MQEQAAPGDRKLTDHRVRKPALFTSHSTNCTAYRPAQLQIRNVALTNVDLLLGQRRRRWTNNKSTLVWYNVFCLLFGDAEGNRPPPSLYSWFSKSQILPGAFRAVEF